MLLDDSLRAVDARRGATKARSSTSARAAARPGSRSRHALPEREVVLLEAERRKCDFLEQWAPPNARVVWGRAEEQETDWAGVALAKALAPPPVAAEWCLPLVRPGGAACSGSGERRSRDRVARGRRAARRGARPRRRRALLVLASSARRRRVSRAAPGVARKRPLA